MKGKRITVICSDKDKEELLKIFSEYDACPFGGMLPEQCSVRYSECNICISDNIEFKLPE